MEVKEEKNDFVKLEPTPIDICVNDGDQKQPFFTSVDNPIKVTLTTFFIFCRNKCFFFSVIRCTQLKVRDLLAYIMSTICAIYIKH
ncbi:hypothetical protein C0J52_14070 [Blattella germanica]|nr:hypothetical protein C0J52_14070 [Blattella germanica]